MDYNGYMKNRIMIVSLLIALLAISAGLIIVNIKPVNDVPKPAPLAQCRPTGCSGQVCSDEDIMTTCEYKEEYACYKSAKCERQASGACGWTETAELKGCLAGAK